MAGRNGKSKECKRTQEAGRSTILLDDEDEHWRSDVYVGAHGYAVLNRSRGKVSLHRVLVGAKHGDVVDHLNGNSLDNRKCNLRLVDHLTNCHNVGLWKTNTSGFKGVYPKRSGRFYACAAGTHIGSYSSPKEANEARLIWEAENWGIQPQRVADYLAAGLLTEPANLRSLAAIKKAGIQTKGNSAKVGRAK